MTSPLLTFLTGREGSQWILATLSFIWGLWSSNSYGVRSVGVINKLIGGLVYLLIFSHWDRANLCLTSFIRTIYLALVSERLIWPMISWDAYHHLMWWIWRFRYLGSKKTLILQNQMKINLLHITSRSSPDVEIQVSPQSNFVQRLAEWFWDFPTRIHICYLCLNSTLSSILPKFS